jgi:hypothetical protein
VGVMTVSPVIPARPSLSWDACATVRVTTRDRPMLDWNSNASFVAHTCSNAW